MDGTEQLVDNVDELVGEGVGEALLGTSVGARVGSDVGAAVSGDTVVDWVQAGVVCREIPNELYVAQGLVSRKQFPLPAKFETGVPPTIAVKFPEAAMQSLNVENDAHAPPLLIKNTYLQALV